MSNLIRLASENARLVGLTGSAMGLVASFIAIGVAGLDAVDVVDPIELRLSRTVLGIAWSVLGVMGATMTGRDPKVAGAFLLAGSVGGLVSIPEYFIVPAVFMIAGGLMFFLLKKSPEKSS